MLLQDLNLIFRLSQFLDWSHFLSGCSSCSFSSHSKVIALRGLLAESECNGLKWSSVVWYVRVLQFLIWWSQWCLLFSEMVQQIWWCIPWNSEIKNMFYWKIKTVCIVRSWYIYPNIKKRYWVMRQNLSCHCFCAHLKKTVYCSKIGQKIGYD